MRKILLILSVFLPGRFRILLLNYLGYKVSLKAKLAPFSIIFAKDVLIEANARIESFTVIAGLKSLTMGSSSSISRFTYITGNGNLNIKNRAFIGSRCILNTNCGDIQLGEYSALSPRSTVVTHGTFLPVTHGYSFKNKGVSVGSYTWIMQNTSIGPGVTIGSNTIVLPGSVVVKQVKDDTVVYDTPVDRKTFPMGMFKKELTIDNLDNLIKEITISFMEYLIKKKRIASYILKENEIQIKSKKQNLVIHFQKPTINCTDQNSSYFSHNIDSKIIDNNKVFILDFYNLLCSNVSTPKILTGYNEYMFYHYGLKFLVNKNLSSQL